MKKILLILGMLALIYQPAWAGTACTDKILNAQEVQNAFRLAVKTRDMLDASGAEVAIIGRVGQDLSQYNLRYSHAGIIWRDNPKGRWLFSHELNQCGTASSALFSEGLANFFFDDMFAWDALVIIPSKKMQTNIADVLRDSDRSLLIHHPNYNMVAHPFSIKYQNSNQWVLELIADAQMQHDKKPNRKAIQTWLKQANYQATTLHIPTLQRLGGRMFKANIAFDDHPMGDRIAGKIQVVSVDSIAAFLKSYDPETNIQTLSLDVSTPM